jgi:D-alanine-D-alanine ligase
MKRRKLRIAVIMGGPSAEHDISIQSGTTMAKALNPRRYDVVPIVIDEKKRWIKAPNILGSGKIQTSSAIIPADEYHAGRLDVALLALHSYGEDGVLQGFLETLGIPYTGPGVFTSALSMDKSRFKIFCRGLGIPVTAEQVVTASQWRSNPGLIRAAVRRLGKKVVVKPNQSGSSAGISIVASKNTRALSAAISAAFRVDRRGLLVEPYLKGREFTVATLGDASNPRALPVIEIIPTADTFFSYTVKYDGSTKEICPAHIPAALAKTLSAIAVKVHIGLGASGVLRTDFIVRNGSPYVLETNTLPGMTPESLVPKAASAAGLSYAQLLDKILVLARKRRS